MDIIADYALALQAENIPVLYRPYHENSGGWFWWGAASTDVETYNALFRYTEDYLASKGVHNFIYVYSPNGPISSEEEYEKRYPGDDYVVVFQIKRAANLQIILAPYKIDVVLQPHYPETLLHITRTKILPCKLIAQEYSVSSYENGSSSSSIWQA